MNRNGICARALITVFALVVAGTLFPGEAKADTIYTTHAGGSRIGTIDTGTGAGTDIGASGFGATWGNVFDNDGTLYAIVNASTLATVNRLTGVATPVGPSMGFTTFPLEIAPDGTMYTASNAGGLYSVNKTTGVATFIGSIGAGLGVPMDLAFDSAGTLWATNVNRLVTINLSTGAGTFITNITGTVSVMGLMFDNNNVLFATDFVPNSPLFQINTSTGVATVVGLTGFNSPHGGDVEELPTAGTITPSTTGPTDAESVDFTVTFNKDVLNFNDASDVVIAHTGSANSGLSITGGPATYTVSVTGISSDGSFTLAVDTGSDVQDLAGNPLLSSATSAAVVIEGVGLPAASWWALLATLLSLLMAAAIVVRRRRASASTH